MKKNNDYACTLRFKDPNMPDIKQKEKTEQLAIATINHWSKQFASISILYYFTPENDKICFDSMGNYAFTIPSETCVTLGLKP